MKWIKTQVDENTTRQAARVSADLAIPASAVYQLLLDNLFEYLSAWDVARLINDPGRLGKMGYDIHVPGQASTQKGE